MPYHDEETNRIQTFEYNAGETYDVDDDTAVIMLSNGWAVVGELPSVAPPWATNKVIELDIHNAEHAVNDNA